jgi:hypothetical protein
MEFYKRRDFLRMAALGGASAGTLLHEHSFASTTLPFQK